LRHCVYTRAHKGRTLETRVGVKEFRAHLPAYLESASPLAITRHGETIGFYIPARPGRNQTELDALAEAAAKLHAMMSALRISQEDVVSEFKARRKAAKSWADKRLS